MKRDKSDLLAYTFFRRFVFSPFFVSFLQCLSLLFFVLALVWGLLYRSESDNLYTTGLFWGLFWPFFIFITTPLFGKLICAVCPIRLINFFAAKRLGVWKKPPKWMTTGLVSLVLVMAFYWMLIYAWPGIFHNPLNTSIYFLIFTVLSLVSVLVYRPSVWCKGLCPVAIPTNIISRIAFLGIRTYRSKCDDCKKPTCFTGRPDFEGCPHGINPSKMINNAHCTLCMKCIDACSHDAVRFGFVRPLKEFSMARFSPGRVEALGLVLLFGALTLTMQFYNGLYRGAMKENFPLAKVAAYIQPYAGSMFTMEGMVALLTFLSCLAFVYFYFSTFSLYTAKIAGREWEETFQLFAWTLLPVFALSSFAQMVEFFFFRYYPMVVNGFLSLFGSDLLVAPLVPMGNHWLLLFKLISIGGAVWSMVFVWNQSEKIARNKMQSLILSTPFWIFYLFVLSGFVAHIIIILFLDMAQVTGPRS